MEVNQQLVQILFKLNAVRINTEKEREIYKVKYDRILNDLKKCKKNETISKTQLKEDTTLRLKLIDEYQKLNQIKKGLNNRNIMLLEENNSLLQEINILKQENKHNFNLLQKLKQENKKLSEEVENLKQI